MRVDWDGMTQPETINESSLQSRFELADAAKVGNWTRVQAIVDDELALANVCRFKIHRNGCYFEQLCCFTQ